MTSDAVSERVGVVATPSNLGYVVIGARHLEAWEHFAVDVIGLQAGRYEPGRLLVLRMDEFEQRLVLEQGDEDDLRAAGWQLDTEGQLEAYVRGLRERGADVHAGDAELTRRRCVERLYTCRDPNGFSHEFYCGPSLAPTHHPFRSSVLVGPGFCTGALGIGHILARALNYAESLDFYERVIGLRLSDRIRAEVRPGHVAEASFFHAAGGRHHSLATGAIASPKALGHLMVELQSMDDVGLAYDRCQREGLFFARQLGHHPNDHMFSFYVETPSGFALEVGWGGLVVDDETWQTRTYGQFSDWGHARPVRPVS